MKPTEDLKHEHEAIKLMLGIMSKVAANLRSQPNPDLDEIDSIIDFLKTFADKCHHGKEETSLFPALIGAGMSRESGPVAVMLYEHQVGRGFIKELDTASTAIRSGNESAVVKAAEAMENYVNLLQNHIQKENNILFPMADQLLPDSEQARIFSEFERIEEEVVGHGVHEQYHALLHQLKDKYQVS